VVEKIGEDNCDWRVTDGFHQIRGVESEEEQTKPDRRESDETAR
jgi:hypothetical protein